VDFIGAKDDGGVVTTGALRRQNVATNNQHPAFYKPDALNVTQPTASKH